ARVPMAQAIDKALRAAGLDPVEVLAKLPDVATQKDKPADPAMSDLVGRWAKTSPRSRRIDWTNMRRGIGACHSDGERTFAAYEYFAEPFLAEDYRSADGSKSVPVFILDYPEAVSPLARRRDDDPSLTERFELFVDGIERCN